YLDAQDRAELALTQLQKVQKDEPWIATCAADASQWLDTLRQAQNDLQALEQSTLAELKQEIDKDEFWSFTTLGSLTQPLQQRREAALKKVTGVTEEVDR